MPKARSFSSTGMGIAPSFFSYYPICERATHALSSSPHLAYDKRKRRKTKVRPEVKAVLELEDLTERGA